MTPQCLISSFPSGVNCNGISNLHNAMLDTIYSKSSIFMIGVMIFHHRSTMAALAIKILMNFFEIFLNISFCRIKVIIDWNISYCQIGILKVNSLFDNNLSKPSWDCSTGRTVSPRRDMIALFVKGSH
jgi:hypothetical protein